MGALPDTIITAMASPIARPTPSTTAAAMPLFAAGADTRNQVSTGVAPRARDGRHFAKRQLTWFRRERDVVWVQKNEILAKNEEDEGKILAFLLKKLKEKGIMADEPGNEENDVRK